MQNLFFIPNFHIFFIIKKIVYIRLPAPANGRSLSSQIVTPSHAQILFQF